MTTSPRYAATILSVGLLVSGPALAQIHNIRQFLDRCPQSDPAIAQIRNDFELRRAGVVVLQLPPCTEPVSAMATSSYSDELIVLQGLRVIYYMDRDLNGHLPWTKGTLYDWMKSKIGGIDIVQGGSFCCEIFGWTPPLPPPDPPLLPPSSAFFIAVGGQDDFNREFDKTWPGISGNIGLYAHETRHRDGYSHVSCCGIPGGCDQVFDPGNLSPYGVQWWLDDLWLNGTIDVGMACLAPIDAQSATNWFLGSLNGSGFPARFCDGKPTAVSAPAVPGGRCLDTQRRRAVSHP